MSRTEPIRIAILTECGPCDGRTNLTLSVLQATADEVRRSADVEIYLIGDDQMGIEGLGCHHEQRGQRWNAAIKSLRESDAEAILLLEADTLVDRAFLELYIEHLHLGYGGLSVFDHYVLDTESDRCVFWDGYVGRLRNTPLANGRCLSRAWLNEVDWHLWKEESEDLTADMVDKWTELILQASHAGESRNFGCIASQVGMVTVRDKGEAFFEQSGDSANTRPIQRAEFLERYYGDMAELILTGEIPDLSFDEPSYHLVEEGDAVDDHIQEEHHPHPVSADTGISKSSTPDTGIDADIQTSPDPTASPTIEPSQPVAVSGTEEAVVLKPTHPENRDTQPSPAPKNVLKPRAIETTTEPAVPSVGPASRSVLKPRATEGIDNGTAPRTGVKLTRRSVVGSTAHEGAAPPVVSPGVTTSVEPTVAADAVPLQDTLDGWVERGEALFATGDLDGSERCFVQALMLNPIDSTALNNLAVVQHQRGHLEQAERLYLKAAIFDGSQADAFVGLIGLSAASGQTGLALRYAARGMRRAPNHPQLLDVVTALAQEADATNSQAQGA